MIKGFILFSYVLNIGTKLFLTFFIAEHFTGFFSYIFGKLTAGCFAVLIANKIAVPKVEKLELEKNKKRN